MAKSTVAQALASLQFKFQAKIREVGQLKKLISEGNNADVEVRRLRLQLDNLSHDLLTTERALNLAEFETGQAVSAFRRLTKHTNEQEGHAAALRSDVSNWKSMAAVLFFVGTAVGVLSALAYVAQTSPL